jgi:hypothetical protein
VQDSIQFTLFTRPLIVHPAQPWSLLMTTSLKKITIAATAALLIGSPALSAAQSVEPSGHAVYAGMDTTGFKLGYGYLFNKNFGLRAEGVALPGMTGNYGTDGVDFEGKPKSRRLAVMADWYPFSNGFRLTGGLSKVNSEIALTAVSQSGSITIGTATVAFDASDSFNGQVKWPSTMPYIGIGYGHNQEKGLGFFLDAGVLYGKATVSGALSPSLTSKLGMAGFDATAELNKELAQVQDTLNKIPYIPILSLGITYRW